MIRPITAVPVAVLLPIATRIPVAALLTGLAVPGIGTVSVETPARRRPAALG
ncbi:hypothetical protein [Nocardia niigatensis]|uniref:hypothetical protein n=1 Tax=Nocardia niigatensis TaxID=209249 RepID=UPI0002E471F7|nr:hypothetical protein [Nocardia niigatensis]